MLTFAFSSLNNDALYTLGLRTDEIIFPHPIEEMGIGMFYGNFKTAFDKYAQAREMLSLSRKLLGQLDTYRDDYFRVFERHLKNYLFHPDEAIKERVASLLYEIERHGPNIPDRRYKDETAILQTIIAKVEAEYMNVISSTNNIWFDLLKKAQADFEKAVHDLSNKEAEKNKIESPSDLRPGLVDAMRKLYTFLPMQYELTQNKELGEIIDQLKVELKRF